MTAMDKIKGYVGKNSDKFKQGIDKATNFADEKTGGKYHDKIDRNARKARSYVDRQGQQDQGGQGQGGQGQGGQDQGGQGQGGQQQ